MANMADCIQAAVSRGELNPATARDWIENLDQMTRRYESSLPPHAAAAVAAADLAQATKAAQRRRFHAVLNQVQAMRRIATLIEDAPNRAVAVRNLLEWSPGSGFEGESVVKLAESYREMAHSAMREVLAEVGLNVLGRSRNSKLLDAMVRELHGEATGDQLAKKYAEAVSRARETLRRSFNAYGGDIGKLSDYGLPHTHDVEKMIKMGREAWIDGIAPRLDWSRIVDHATGRPFATSKGQRPPAAIERQFLEMMFDHITTGGWSKRGASLTMGGKALYNQHADARLLHFKSGQDWLDYNRAFGSSDPFTGLMSGIHSLADDVALMRVLGPNPNAGLTYALGVAQSLTAKDGRLSATRREAIKREIEAEGKVIRAMLAHQSGAANVPERIGFARFMGGVRAVLTSVQLGSAAISSITDLATIGVAAKMVGMNPAGTLARTVGMALAPGQRKLAAQMGYIAETLADTIASTARYHITFIGSGLPDKVANFTLRATLLTFLTDTRRLAWQLEMSAHFARNADLAFDEIDPRLRKLFTERGISAADWDQLRAPGTRFVAKNGAEFISPWFWLEHQTAMPRAEAEGLATRLSMVMRERLELALPTRSLEMRARFLKGSEPGSVLGEVGRSAYSYMGFASSFTLNQMRTIAAQPTPLSKAGYAAALATVMIPLGAIALQQKQISKGNDPRPMDDPKFWLAAFMQSGGIGIFGDLFFAATARNGRDLKSLVAGPTIGFIGDTAKLAGTAVAAAAGADVNLGGAATRYARYNTPFFSSAWYARAAFDRLVADTLQDWFDPEAERSRRRAVSRLEREYGTRPWWMPGDLLPSRGPDLTNALGDLAR